MHDGPDHSLRTVAESLPQPVWIAGPDGKPRYFNRAWYAFTGREPGPVDASPCWDIVHADHVEGLRQRWEDACRATAPFEAEARLQAADGRALWFVVRAIPLKTETGALQGWLCTFTDIDAQRTAEESRQALAREMNHRVKNLFAVASGLVSMTARSAKTTKEMADALRGRLGALSRAHELVRSSLGAEHGGQSTSLDTLIRAVVAPYAQEGSGGRLTLDGPAVPVGSGTVTNLALVLHELATNTAKYGSLSAPGGRLAIAWKSDGERVDLSWTETDGPRLDGEPPAEGFGGQLTRRTVTGQLGGEMHYDWQPDGLRLHMTLSLDRLAW